MAPQEVLRQLREIQEAEAVKKLEEKEKKIQKEIMHRILNCQKKLKEREREVLLLEKKCKTLHDQGKSFSLWWCTWKLNRKRRQLEELRKITPSSKSSALRRMLDEL